MSPGIAEMLLDESHYKRYPMRVVCSGCGGAGCELCFEPESPAVGRWAATARPPTKESEVSPRIVPRQPPLPADAAEAERRMRDHARRAAGTRLDPYALQHRPAERYDVDTGATCPPRHRAKVSASRRTGATCCARPRPRSGRVLPWMPAERRGTSTPPSPGKTTRLRLPASACALRASLIASRLSGWRSATARAPTSSPQPARRRTSPRPLP